MLHMLIIYKISIYILVMWQCFTNIIRRNVLIIQKFRDAQNIGTISVIDFILFYFVYNFGYLIVDDHFTTSVVIKRLS